MSSAAAPVPGPSFRPGDLFAGRYRMVSCIGRGGMGEVWRADDLVLETPVALKLIPVDERGDPAARERMLTEVRVARQITDPAICRVFDIGEADNTVFYSMELVTGQDLATLLRRAGRLPSEKVRDIGRQLCTGLMAAHSHGVLHRDLKPANVLIDEDGLVRITDFGIAAAPAVSSHTVIGTPGYMAPEQRSPGGRLTEKTDIYALGIVLYELVTGRRPETAVRTKKPSSVVSDVDPHLERAIMQAICEEPADRPASAAAMAALLDQADSPVHPTASGMRMWLAGAALALVLGAVAVGGAWLLPRSSRALTDKDSIVIADVVNTTGDPVFDGALKVALAVALEQSPFVRVFPEDSVHETLRLMQRDPATPVTRSVAREIAQREQLKASVAGSIGPLGSHYVVALEAVNAQTGDTMAREQGEAASKEDVLATLGAIAARLREKLGESLASVQRFDVPLARATTSSLEALDAYSRALDQGRILPRAEAIPYLQRAIELDPDFALAHALLSGVYTNTGRAAEAPVHSRKAFDLRDRVSERERFFISWRYYMDAAQAWDEALSLARAWTATYPREAFAFNSLGLASSTFGQHEEAVEAFRKAIELDPKFIPPYGNMAGSLIALNRFDEARRVLVEAAARGIDFVSIRRVSYRLAFLAGDQAAMSHELELVRGTPDAPWASNWQGRTAEFEGRFGDAHAAFRQAVDGAIHQGMREFAGQWMLEDAEAHAIAGDCASARREAGEGLGHSRDNFTLERASRTFALCGDAAGSERLNTELATRFASATLTTRLQIPVARAALAFTRGDLRKAIDLLEPVKPYDRTPAAEFWPSYLRGMAQLQIQDAREATEQFQSIVQRRGAAPTSPLFALAHLGLARAAAQRGDRDAAERTWVEFSHVWQRPDSTMPAIADARRELARLQ